MTAVSVSMSQLSRLAVPAILAVMVVAPAVVTIITGRDLLEPETLDPGNLTELTEWMLRFVTLGILGLSCLLVLQRSLQRTGRAAEASEWSLLLGFLAFFVGNALIPGLLGAEPHLPRTYFYVLLLFLAIFVRREDGTANLVDTLKWTLLIFMLVSFVYAVARPNASLRFYAPELRLPFVTFRFWGLSSSANTMGPLALLTFMMTLVRPFPSRWLNRFAQFTSLLVVALAQSQTTWLGGLLVVPMLLYYRHRRARGGTWQLRLPPGLLLAASGFGAAAIVLAVALWFDGDGNSVEPTLGLAGYGELLTGRGNIWRVAIKTFLENPIFGYGLSAWTLEFRTALHMPFATSAHNQLLQSLSVGGVLGGLGFLLYAAAMVRRAYFSRAFAGDGLAQALVAFTLLRCLTEAPLELGTLLVADMVFHVLIFALLLAGGRRATSSRLPSGEPPLLSRRHRRQRERAVSV